MNALRPPEIATPMTLLPRTSPARLTVLILLLGGAGCAALEEASRGPDAPGRPAQDRLAAPTTPGDALAVIARLEEARDDGGGLLEILAGMFDPEVRTRAVLALGRLDPETFGGRVTDALVACLDDPVAEVRATAAFSLGQRADAAAADALLEHRRDPEPEVRAAIVEAAGRIDDPRLRALVLDSMRHPLEAIRRVAVTAPHAWPATDPAAAAVDAALVEVLARPSAAEAAAAGAPGGESAEVHWRAAFALQRRDTGAGRDVLLRHASSPAPLVRLFATKGLARLEPDEPALDALLANAADEDWRVAVEALRGLAEAGDRRALDAFERASSHPSHHVRTTAAEGLGRFRVDASRVEDLLARMARDDSGVVRASALVSIAQVGGPSALAAVRRAAEDPDPVVRGGAALAAGAMSGEVSGDLRLALSRDANPRVAGLAVSTLADRDDPRARERLTELIRGEDDGLRLAAIESLGERVGPGDLPVLRFAYGAAGAELAAEVRTAALRAVSGVAGEAALAFLREGSADPHPWVRRTANELLRERGDEPPPAAAEARADPLPVAVAPRFAGPPPRVVIETTRGAMTFELFPDEAPTHVHSFLELARRDHYDGLDFHRVVADFVIQGGCHRGDGNGGGTWRGPADSLRHEFGRRSYVRGSLGMPRGADPDSGGSQLFVTHRPTPHLDGRYTIFGELREGFEVLDAIEVGDRILDVRER